MLSSSPIRVAAVPYPFLSPEWIAAAQEIRDEFAAAEAAAGPAPIAVTVNITIQDAPFSDEPIFGHVDTTTSPPTIDHGHIDTAELHIEAPYDVTRSIFVDRDAAKAMSSFFEGKIKATGDISKLLAIQPPSRADVPSEAGEIARKLDAITE